MAIDTMSMGAIGVAGYCAGLPPGPGLMALSVLGIVGARCLVSGFLSRSAPNTNIVLPEYCDAPVPPEDPLHRMVGMLAHRLGIRQPVSLFYGDVDFAGAFDAGYHHFGIVLNPNIISHLSPREMRFVLAHELAHIKNRDMDRNLSDVMAYTVPMVAVAKTMTDVLNMTSPVGLVGAMTSIAALSILQSMQTRVAERRADQTALKVTKDPDAAIGFFDDFPVLSKIVRQTKEWQRRHPKKSTPKSPYQKMTKRIYAPHPADELRIEYLQAWKKRHAVRNVCRVQQNQK